MEGTRFRNGLRATLIGAWIVCAFAAFGQSVFTNPFKGADPAEYDRAVRARDSLQKLPDSSSVKTNYQFLFTSLDATRSMMQTETHPTFYAISRYRVDESAWFKDREAYMADNTAYSADVDAYKAAGGGGTYDTTDPKYAMLVAWYNKLIAWKGRLDDWSGRINRQIPELNAREASIKSSLVADYEKWKTECTDYAVTVEKIVARGEIEAKLEELRRKMALDKRELSQYTQLPGLYADIEKMAQDADEAREEGRMGAIDEITGWALEGLTKSVDARAKVARGKLAEIERILAKHGVSDKDVGLVLKNHKGVTITREHELLEQLGKFKDVASAYDATTKKQYLEALASLLSTFVQSPIYKLAITNFKVYSSLVYTGLSYNLAKARVNQYNKLSEQQLAAVAKISELYKKHVREEKKLKEQLAALG